MRVNNVKHKIILILFLIALTSSLILSIIPIPLICSPTEGCYTVQNSTYARTFNIKNDYFGDAIFALMSVLIISYLIRPTKGKDFVIRTGTFFGTLTAIYFIYLQVFVIHAFCKYCMVIDVSMILAFIIAIIPFKNKKPQGDTEEIFVNENKIEMHIEE